MKKKFLFTLALQLIVFISCDNNKDTKTKQIQEEIVDSPDADADKMLEKVKNLTTVINAAVEDNVLDDKEIQKIKSLSEDLDQFEKGINEKYQNDKKGQDEMEKYVEKNKTQITKIYDDYFEAMMTLYECEGAEKLSD